MSAPVHINLLNFFYGVGNTPAVCLTQGLAREDDADVLLLGCGDARNILCTIYSRSQSEDQRLDITCCDIEVAVIARNIVLFTLLLDDQDGSNRDAIWSIYYHLYLDDEALALLQQQVKKLCAHSTDWDNSNYGALLKFVSTETLANVRHMWASYNVTTLNEDEKSAYDIRFKDGIRRAVEMRINLTGGGVVLTSVRSAAPLGLKAMRDAPSLFQYYWMHGITQGSHERVRRARYPNPMFASVEGDTFIHYGTDPLLGFHLAAAFLGLDGDSPLHPKDTGLSGCHRMVLAARKQFQAWSNSFRHSARRNVVLRFCVADAIALCHSLQYTRVKGAATCANLYRDPWHHIPLVFDNIDRSAPTSFDVIDTSNLVDSLGAINLLVAVIPLLKERISSTIYTETLFRHEMDIQKAVENLICGDLPTIAVLLGLFPVEYWTNATAASTIDDVLLTSVMQKMYKTTGTKGGHRLRNQVAWKLSPAQTYKELDASFSIQFNEEELSQILFQIYLNMFQEESLGYQKLELHMTGKQKTALPVRYTRASFAVLIHFLSERVDVDWSKTVFYLLDLIRDDTSLAMGTNYFAELNLHLHILGIDPLARILQSSDFASLAYCLDFGFWKKMPPIFVCITLRVPRAKLKVFTNMRRGKLGTPLLRCTLRASTSMAVHLDWLNDFAALQLGFGEIRTSGTRDGNEFSITIVEDRNSWKGNSPLIVSFLAPTPSVLVEPIDARLIFGVKESAQSSLTFGSTLGPELNVYETYLGDRENVFITKHPPNLSGYSSIGSITKQKQSSSSSQAASISVNAHIDPETSKITGYTGHISYLCEVLQQNLLDGLYVKRVQVDPFTIKVTVGNGDTGHFLCFPTPILLSCSRTHVGRRSSYVKINTPLLHPIDLTERTDLLFPMSISANGPVLWNLHHVNLERLPLVDVSKKSELDFLTPHLSLIFSTRERDVRDRSMNCPEIRNEVRIEFKDSLFTMFMRFTGLQGKTTRVFILVHSSTEANRGTHIVIIGSCMRFDLANHTVVLDAAALVTTTERMPQLLKFLEILMTLEVAAIRVSEEEFKLWKQVLPGFVERGRDWEHKSTCEYAVTSRIPLSVDIDKTPICSCGLGKLPSNFITGIPLWGEVSKYAVRIAIPPCFPNPIVEPVGFDAKLKLPLHEEKACRVCKKVKTGEGKGLLQCGRCREVEYCSEKCQREDWGRHKMSCNET